MPSFNSKLDITFGDILTVIGFVFTIVTLVFAGWQFRKTAQSQRATFLMNIIDWFFRDDDIRALYYKLDWEKSLNGIGDGSTEEKALDETLYMLDTFGYLIETKVLSLEEIQIISYQILRIMGNQNVKDYLAYLDRDYKGTEKIGKAHIRARWLEYRIREHYEAIKS